MGFILNTDTIPGQALEFELKALEVPQRWLSVRTGLSEKHINKIINGEASISAETAVRLENALGLSAAYWIDLNAQYQIQKARLKQENRENTERKILSDIPYKELVSLGWIEEAENDVEKVMNLYRFFGINSLEQIKTTQAVHFTIKSQGWGTM